MNAGKGSLRFQGDAARTARRPGIAAVTVTYNTRRARAAISVLSRRRTYLMTSLATTPKRDQETENRA